MRDTTTLSDAVRLLEVAPHGQLPVVDARGAYQGVLTAQSVADFLASDEPPAPAGDLVELSPRVQVDDPLDRALADLKTSATTGLPVLDRDGHRLAGWLNAEHVLHALQPGEAPEAVGGRSRLETH